MKQLHASLFACAAAVLLCCAGSAFAQSMIVSKGTGDSMTVDLGYGIALNKTSTLSRQWYVLNDPRLPLRVESGSVAPKFVSGRSRGDYRYSADYAVTTGDQAVMAFELRFLVLDVFGAHQRLLSATSVADIPANGRHADNGQWNLYSETDASSAYYSIAFVANVRTADGRIHRADSADVLREIQKISAAITASDIVPEKAAAKP